VGSVPKRFWEASIVKGKGETDKMGEFERGREVTVRPKKTMAQGLSQSGRSIRRGQGVGKRAHRGDTCSGHGAINRRGGSALKSFHLPPPTPGTHRDIRKQAKNREERRGGTGTPPILSKPKTVFTEHGTPDNEKGSNRFFWEGNGNKVQKGTEVARGQTG